MVRRHRFLVGRPPGTGLCSQRMCLLTADAAKLGVLGGPALAAIGGQRLNAAHDVSNDALKVRRQVAQLLQRHDMLGAALEQKDFVRAMGGE